MFRIEIRTFQHIPLVKIEVGLFGRIMVVQMKIKSNCHQFLTIHQYILSVDNKALVENKLKIFTNFFMN